MSIVRSGNTCIAGYEIQMHQSDLNTRGGVVGPGWKTGGS